MDDIEFDGASSHSIFQIIRSLRTAIYKNNTMKKAATVGKRASRRTVSSFSGISPHLLLSLIFDIVLVAVVIVPLRGVASTVVLPQYNRSFTSLPGNFGGKLNERDPPVLAHLTIIKNQPFLCPDELKHIQPQPPFYNNDGDEKLIGNNGNSNGSGNSTLPDTGESTPGREDNDDNNNFSSIYEGIEKLPQPEDGLPIALLVERGMCAFYDKAVMASRYGDAVKYVIVYDDQVSHDLVAMSSKFTTNITLLFVSSLSGQGTCKSVVLLVCCERYHQSVFAWFRGYTRVCYYLPLSQSSNVFLNGCLPLI